MGRHELKIKKCGSCGRKYDVMMKVDTSEFIDGVRKKSKTRWFCPVCMRMIVRTLDYKQ